MTDSNREKKSVTPTESDEIAADAAVNEGGKTEKVDPPDDVVDYEPDANPPRTTTGRFFTAPKFGSAGSGGLEFEPGPEKD